MEQTLRKFTLILGLLGLFVSTNLWAKVYVISDIDDTIKKANSADGGVMQAYHFLRKKIYPEMRDLFVELKYVYERLGEEVEFHYVSAAPDFTFNQDKWLQEHNFPEGEATLKRFGDGDTYTYKTNTISAILENAVPNDTVYFFGDNSSKDAIVYKELTQKFGLKSFIYIRDVETDGTYWNDELPIHQLEGIYYFFSEVELIDQEGLFFMSDKLANDIRQAYLKKELIPRYTFRILKRRLRNEWGCKLDKGCWRIAKEVAGDFWQDYHQRF
jgi:hypothetical protein